ncbi:MAG: hypothetical protein CMK59_14160 [Proteobacteria bacterium]|nr:hypothetical protein [Pseudomonadota bacterium]
MMILIYSVALLLFGCVQNQQLSEAQLAVRNEKLYTLIGDLYYQGRLVSVNKSKAKKFWIQACNHGSVESCYNMGLFLKRSDKSKALSFFERACEKSHTEACFEAGILHHEDENFAEAHKLYEKVCQEAKQKEGCYNLGILYSDQEKHSEAIPYFEQSCTLGYSDGCFATGVAFIKTNNDEKAFDYFQKSCDKDIAQGCYYVGGKYLAQEKHSEAMTYLEKSCTLGFNDGCSEMGNEYAKQGQILNRQENYEEAFKAFIQACEYSSPEGCLQAGIFLKVLGDSAEAESMFMKSCNIGARKGFLEGCFNSKYCTDRESPECTEFIMRKLSY